MRMMVCCWLRDTVTRNSYSYLQADARSLAFDWVVPVAWCVRGSELSSVLFQVERERRSYTQGVQWKRRVVPQSPGFASQLVSLTYTSVPSILVHSVVIQGVYRRGDLRHLVPHKKTFFLIIFVVQLSSALSDQAIAEN